jgi:peptidyl-prolyl cis-trans isomerase D
VFDKRWILEAMISYLRRVFVESWLGRVTAVLVFLAFVGWGVGDVIGHMDEGHDVAARVGKQTVTAGSLASALQAELPAAARQAGMSDPSQLSPIMRRQMALQILQRLTGRAEVLEAARNMGLIIPDSAVRDEIFSLPNFKGANGRFDRATFNAVLQQRHLTEEHVIQLVRDDLTVRAVLLPMAEGASVPDIMVRRFITFGARTHVVDFTRIPFAAQPTPAVPDDKVLRRYYANHPWLFRVPELRHARIVVLSPQTVADTLTLDESRIKQIYAEQSSRFNTPETRDVQLITLPTQEQAQNVSSIWRTSGDWAAAQKAAGNAASVDMPGTRAAAIPSEILSKAIFSAPAGIVSAPVKTEAGWAVFRASNIKPGQATSYDVARGQILDEYRKAATPSAINERLRPLQDAIAAKGLDAIPDTLGAVAISGTLTAQGLTADGTPAPIPATGAVRDAIIHQIFAQKEGAPPFLSEGPDNSWFAVAVDTVQPSSPLSFEKARPQVIAAWQAENQRHAADLAATALYTAAKTKGALGSTIAAGAQTTRGAAFALATPNKNIPAELMTGLPTMKPGQAFMAEDDNAFFVAVVTRVFVPNPPAPEQTISKLRVGLSQAVGEDIAASYINALSRSTPPRISQAGVDTALAEAGFGGSTP